MELQISSQAVHQNLQLEQLVLRGLVGDIFASVDLVPRPLQHHLELAALVDVQSGARQKAGQHGLAQSQVLSAHEKLQSARISET